MNLSVLNKYNITFEKSAAWGNLISSPNLILNQFAINTISNSELNEAIDYIDSVLKNEIPKMTLIDNSLMTVAFDKLEVKFYDNPDFNEETAVIFSMPTNDFREIIISWKEFVLRKE